MAKVGNNMVTIGLSGKLGYWVLFYLTQTSFHRIRSFVRVWINKKQK